MLAVGYPQATGFFVSLSYTGGIDGGMRMSEYMIGVMLLSFAIDALLLVAAGRLSDQSPRLIRLVIAAGVNSLYAALCLLPTFYFLGNLHWRIACLAITAAIAYGFSQAGFRGGLAFCFLYLALGGAVTAIGDGGIIGILCSAAIVCLLCGFGLRFCPLENKYIPVELSYKNKCVSLTALRDTGNTLRDPVTGQQVLVISGDIATELTGLTREQLRKPLDAIGIISGLRLIPYHSVDNNGGFLLAMRMHNSKIGSWRGSALVAFAPEVLNREGVYQALTGGTV